MKRWPASPPTLKDPAPRLLEAATFAYMVVILSLGFVFLFLDARVARGGNIAFLEGRGPFSFRTDDADSIDNELSPSRVGGYDWVYTVGSAGTVVFS